jgi:hypothetical protein
MKKLATLISNELKSLREAVPDTGQEAASIALRIAGLTTLNTKTLKEIQGNADRSSGLDCYWKKNITWAEAVEYFLNTKIADITE